MSIDNLKNTLKDLHGHLASAGPVDPELRSLLQQLDDDIRHLLNRQEGEPENGLAERAQQLSARFAAQHPQLEGALRELARTLDSLGI